MHHHQSHHHPHKQQQHSKTEIKKSRIKTKIQGQESNYTSTNQQKQNQNSFWSHYSFTIYIIFYYTLLLLEVCAFICISISNNHVLQFQQNPFNIKI